MSVYKKTVFASTGVQAVLPKSPTEEAEKEELPIEPYMRVMYKGNQHDISKEDFDTLYKTHYDTIDGEGYGDRYRDGIRDQFSKNVSPNLKGSTLTVNDDGSIMVSTKDNSDLFSKMSQEAGKLGRRSSNMASKALYGFANKFPGHFELKQKKEKEAAELKAAEEKQKIETDKNEFLRNSRKGRNFDSFVGGFGGTALSIYNNAFKANEDGTTLNFNHWGNRFVKDRFEKELLHETYGANNEVLAKIGYNTDFDWNPYIEKYKSGHIFSDEELADVFQNAGFGADIPAMYKDKEILGKYLMGQYGSNALSISGVVPKNEESVAHNELLKPGESLLSSFDDGSVIVDTKTGNGYVRRHKDGKEEKYLIKDTIKINGEDYYTDDKGQLLASGQPNLPDAKSMLEWSDKPWLIRNGKKEFYNSYAEFDEKRKSDESISKLANPEEFNPTEFINRIISNIYKESASSEKVSFRDNEIDLQKPLQAIAKEGGYELDKDAPYTAFRLKNPEGDTSKSYLYYDNSGTPYLIRDGEYHRMNDSEMFFNPKNKNYKYVRSLVGFGQLGMQFVDPNDTRKKFLELHKDNLYRYKTSPVDAGKAFSGDYEITNEDMAEIAAMAGDLGSLFLPSIASAGVGALSSGANAYARYKRSGSFNLKDLAFDLGADAISAIPVAGTFGKMAKIGKNLPKITKIVNALAVAGQTTLGGLQIKEAARILEQAERDGIRSLNTNDVVAIARAFQGASRTVRGIGGFMGKGGIGPSEKDLRDGKFSRVIQTKDGKESYTITKQQEDRLFKTTRNGAPNGKVIVPSNDGSRNYKVLRAEDLKGIPVYKNPWKRIVNSPSGINPTVKYYEAPIEAKAVSKSKAKRSNGTLTGDVELENGTKVTLNRSQLSDLEKNKKVTIDTGNNTTRELKADELKGGNYYGKNLFENIGNRVKRSPVDYKPTINYSDKSAKTDKEYLRDFLYGIKPKRPNF